MKLNLTKAPKNPIIINGFPGFGMVGTIATEFLIEHLKTEKIGKIVFEDMPAMVAIHEGKVVEPFGIFYNKKYNIVIIHSIGGPQGSEWKLSEVILQIANDLKAKEIISLEGVASADEADVSKTYHYSTDEAKSAEFGKLKIEKLTEGIIMGVTSALLIKSQDSIPISCLFAETHSKLPDSKAAASIIEALDNYLNLEVDYKPLLAMAEKFEKKLRTIIQQGKTAEEEKDKKAMSYVG